MTHEEKLIFVYFSVCFLTQQKRRQNILAPMVMRISQVQIVTYFFRGFNYDLIVPFLNLELLSILNGFITHPYIVITPWGSTQET